MASTTPPFDDSGSSEILLQSVFFNCCYTHNIIYFEYFHISKTDLLNTIKARQEKIGYIKHMNDNTEEMIEAGSMFLD